MDLPPEPPMSPSLGYYASGPTFPKPAAITVISIVAIVLGSLLILLDGARLMWALAELAFANSNFMTGPNLFQTTSMKVGTLIEAFIGLALASILLAAGTGAIQLRRWARTLMLRWAIAEVIFQVSICAVNLYLMITAPIPAVQQQVITVNKGQGVVTYNHHASAGGIFGVVATVLTLLILCVLPLFVLIFWRKPEVVEAFDAAAAATSPASGPRA